MKIYILLRRTAPARCYSPSLSFSPPYSLSFSLSFSTLEIFPWDFNSPWFVSRPFHPSSSSSSLARPPPPTAGSIFSASMSPFPPPCADNMPNAYSISKIHCVPERKKTFISGADPPHKFQSAVPSYVAWNAGFHLRNASIPRVFFELILHFVKKKKKKEKKCRDKLFLLSQMGVFLG